ncbi:MAG: hypothetical protein Q8Q08_02050 [Candidatus Omnitrophota bacterium]|nr:hypothetical protein [Candidatus Omnitrophota bacterium]MDZ4241486.1 hypothetical protein [Candidatus Omnitrophota bacterium]
MNKWSMGVMGLAVILMLKGFLDLTLSYVFLANYDPPPFPLMVIYLLFFLSVLLILSGTALVQFKSWGRVLAMYLVPMYAAFKIYFIKAYAPVFHDLLQGSGQEFLAMYFDERAWALNFVFIPIGVLMAAAIVLFLSRGEVASSLKGEIHSIGKDVLQSRP